MVKILHSGPLSGVPIICAGAQIIKTMQHLFQIWFYTNSIFENAGISVSQVQYTTVGTGAIEVIAGLTGVRNKILAPTLTFNFTEESDNHF